jgi:hypothetical protein
VPDDYPWPSLAVTVRSDTQAATAEVRPGAPADVVVALGAGGATSTIAIESERTFVPADAPELLQHDRRELGVMLLSVEQRP